ncbi:ECs1072 family phage-associated protein [Morganella morganii]|uniref:ECs1072 family phage-associated protein n=1 Tax=Morganella morganii TaxID=582 RepID=UPI0014052EDE|nr:hypothetical protein [Morganella morganii subsp. morganii]MBT0498573.1 hypothetical protein [Morganella morganii subsp. morganii]QIM75835.1 hypothetical protein F3L16_07030 [Morganella morganii subsp. morganii]QWL98187.1 hypothetical protein IZ183_06855 [Morganella morganii subsp. morganii]
MKTGQLATLFEQIQRIVYPFYNAIYNDNYSRSGDKDSAKLHSYMLLVLEIYIADYKEKLNLSKTPFIKLTGDSVLRHAILTEYRYPIEQANSLSLQQMVFLLLKHLSPDSFCEGVRDYLNVIKLNSDHSKIDWNLKVSWNLGDGADYLSGPDTE